MSDPAIRNYVILQALGGGGGGPLSSDGEEEERGLPFNMQELNKKQSEFFLYRTRCVKNFKNINFAKGKQNLESKNQMRRDAAIESFKYYFEFGISMLKSISKL